MLSTWEFVDVLAASNLLSPELVARIRKRVTDSGGSVDPRSIAKYLVDKNQLTHWQANQLLAGRTAFYLGRYKLLDRIGKGGMGVVFKARHAVMDRVVALKVMSRALLNNQQAVARFNREVKTAAALNHPNIIAAYDADAVGNTHFLVMEYIEGRDLNAWLKAKGPLPVAAACECAIQAAEGLSYAHRQGLVHRDIKPVNLLLYWDAIARRPIVKILDLGLARFVSESQEDGGLTRIGQTIGTPDYIAPEAAESFKDADIRADIFSLGCALFKLLTGRLPFAGDNTMEKLVARTSRDAPPLRNGRPDAPPELEAVLARMLARRPENRYQTPAEVVAALAPFSALATGDSAALGFFSEPLPDASDAFEIEPDADTSLAEFFQDFSVSPVREERPAAKRPSPSGGELELLPLEEDAKNQQLTRAMTQPLPPLEPEPKPAAAPPEPKRALPPLPSAPKLVEPIDEDAVVAAHDDPEPIVERRRAKSLDDLGGGAPRPVRKKPAAAPVIRKNKWDSPLLLAGGGALLLLVVAAGALYWSVNRTSGDDLYDAAQAKYKQGAYPEAVVAYDVFLSGHGSHENASSAKVWRGLAKIRQALADTSDAAGAFAAAETTMTAIAKEKAFGEASNELTSILPSLAEALTRQAQRQQKQDLVEKGRQALTLVDQYIAKDVRPGQRLAEISRALDATTREIARNAALEKTIAGMQAAAAEAKTADAYALRQALLKEYPDLVDDAKLREAVVAVAAAERKAVVVDQTPQAAETSAAESPLLGAVSLANRQGKDAPDVAGRVAFGLAAGCVYGLDATTGNLLWRRNVGADAQATPRPVSDEPGADALLVDAGRQELWRIDSKTGQPRWRAVIGGIVVGEPAILRDQVWVARQDGQLANYKLETGERLKTVKLPQQILAPPTAAPSGKHLYVAGQHSSLFVISPETGECEEVVYLAHAAGSVVVSPVAVSRYVYVAENDRLAGSRLRVLLADENGLALKEIKELRLEGHVTTAPEFADRALYVVTDLGAINAFEVGTPGQLEPLTRVAQVPPTAKDHAQRLFALRRGRLWVAADKLLRYDVQLAKGQLVPAGERFEGDSFLKPLAALGNVLFAAHQRRGQSGINVSALDVNSGDPYWETELATELAGVVPGKDSVTALSASGALFELPLTATSKTESTSAPIARVDLPRPLSGAARAQPLGGEAIVFSAGGADAKALLVGRDGDKLRLAPLEPADRWAAAPIAFAGGLVGPTASGDVRWVAANGDSTAIQPFAPSRAAADRRTWSSPVALAGDQLVVADDDQLYLLALRDKPLRHLALVKQQRLEHPLASPLAAVGNVIYAVDGADRVLAIAAPSLEIKTETTLAAPAEFGPVTVGARVCVSDGDHRLLAFAGEAKPAWQVEPRLGPLVAIGSGDENQILCAFAGGVVAKLDVATGAIAGKIETGERLAGGLISKQAGKLLLSARDGTLVTLDAPQ